MDIETQVKNAIRGAGFSMEVAAGKLNMTRGNIYYHLKKPGKDFIDLLNSKLGLSLKTDELLSRNTDNLTYTLSDGVEKNVKDELIDSLQQTIKTQKEVIKMQRLRITELEAQVNASQRRRSA